MAGVEVSKTGIDWVDRQLQGELDALKSSKFDKDISINYLRKLNKNSYKEMMSKNSGATVVAIQVLLKEAGYNVGKVDGILRAKGKVTSQTMEAIKAFQRKNGLNPDGAPGPLTVNKLLELYGKGGRNGGGNEYAKENDEKVKDLTEKEYEALHKKTSLTDDEVRQIVKYANKNDVAWERLNLKKITDKQAEELGKVESLSLDGLTSISDKQAEELGKVESLSLDGLTSISDKQAESLSKVKYLSLGGLTSIEDKQAEELGKVEDLFLDGLTSISDKQAESLSKVKYLTLKGLTSISDKQATELDKAEILIIKEEILTPKQKQILGRS